jgi:phosphatidylserine decarboxylase
MDLGLKLLGSRFGHQISRAVGWAANRRWPRPLLSRAIRLYSRVYGVKLEEAALAPESFGTFVEFFTRELKPGSRTLDPDPAVLCSPADSTLLSVPCLRSDALVQAKGLSYSMAELVGSEEWAALWDGGSYLNFYLHPADYHRFHAPCEMRVLEAVHLPGRLLPVNDWSRRQVQGLFAGNERIVVRAAVAGGEMLVVLVAATSVGKVRVVFDEHLTTHNGAREPERRSYAEPVLLGRGDELGRFELGSTVIVLLQRGVAEVDEREPDRPIRLGERVGRLRRP